MNRTQKMRYIKLRSHCTDISAADDNGWTPLHFASRYGREAVARLLLDKGAGISLVDR
jgi:ankyrin repeat protein